MDYNLIKGNTLDELLCYKPTVQPLTHSTRQRSVCPLLYCFAALCQIRSIRRSINQPRFSCLLSPRWFYRDWTIAAVLWLVGYLQEPRGPTTVGAKYISEISKHTTVVKYDCMSPLRHNLHWMRPRTHYILFGRFTVLLSQQESLCIPGTRLIVNNRRQLTKALYIQHCLMSWLFDCLGA